MVKILKNLIYSTPSEVSAFGGLFSLVFFRDDYGESQELVLLTAQPLRVQTLFHTYNNMDIEVKIRGLGTVRPPLLRRGTAGEEFCLT